MINRVVKCRLLFWKIILCILAFCSPMSATTNLVLYPTNPDHVSDGKITGTLNGQSATFEYQHTYHPESEGDKDFKANYVRFAADGPVNVTLSVNAAISTAYLRTVGKDLPFTRSGSNFTFTLPGPGNYYLQLPDLNTAGRATYTVFFFFDDLAAYNSYQTSFASAKNVTTGGVTSNPTLDQTTAVQNLINSYSSIYFPAGIYRTRNLTIGSNKTIYLGPGAVLKGTDNYNTSRYIYTNNASNVRIAGLGTIDANGFASGNIPTKGHLYDLESTSGAYLEDVIFRNSNSWLLHLRRSSNLTVRNVKVFSGKDGIDPDGCSDVLIERAVIQSVDDGFAVKSKFSGRNCERVTMRDCIVFSCASSLKIGTENYYGAVRDITWDHCDAVDADRGCIIYTNEEDGEALVYNITWRNIRVFSFPWAVETGGAPIQIHNLYGGSVYNLLFENITAYPTTGSSTYGGFSATLRNIIMNGASYINSSNITFDGVIWPYVSSLSKPVVFINPSTRNQNEFCIGDQITVNVQHPYSKTITRVDLVSDGVSLGSDTTAPYTFTLSGVALGSRTVQATAWDSDGASNTTAPYRIKVLPSPVPPVAITSGPAVSGITQNSAQITWSTNPAGNSVVEYGPTAAYGQMVSNPAVVANHSITLTGLAAGSVYHYRVKTQASGYSDAVSSDYMITTPAAPGTLINPGFEHGPAQTAWTKYGVFDSSGTNGITTGPWFAILPYEGIYMAGSAASYERKSGGFYQQVTGITPGDYWCFGAWVLTYNKGSSSPTYTNNRVGIDPTGGTNPYMSSIVWSPRCSTQNIWQYISVSARAQNSAITVFLDAQQLSAVEWNTNAFDHCSLTRLVPSAISQARKMTDGSTVTLADLVVTAGTSEAGGGFYVEEANRSAGMRVAWNGTVNRGARVIVTGSAGNDEHGERQITAGSVSVVASNQAVPRPVCLAMRSLGGVSPGAPVVGAWQGLGLYNTGLLVTCFGRITHRDSGFFYIDDGSNLLDGSGYTGVRVECPGFVIPTQAYALVTGISTLRRVNGNPVRAIRTRVQGDLVGL